MGARNPSPTTGPPAQGSSARKVSPHNFLLQKPAGTKLVEETARASRIPLKESTHGLTY